MAITKDEALKLALEAMGWTDEWRPEGLKEQAITAIREALAEQPNVKQSLTVEQPHCDDCGGFDPKCPLVQPAQQQEPVASEHITDGRPCWCEPETNYKDPETGISVIVHKEPQ